MKQVIFNSTNFQNPSTVQHLGELTPEAWLRDDSPRLLVKLRTHKRFALFVDGSERAHDCLCMGLVSGTLKVTVRYIQFKQYQPTDRTNERPTKKTLREIFVPLRYPHKNEIFWWKKEVFFFFCTENLEHFIASNGVLLFPLLLVVFFLLFPFPSFFSIMINYYFQIFVLSTFFI